MTEPEHIKIEGPQQLQLDVDDVRIIVATLRKQPYELVANTLDKIKAQLLRNKGVGAAEGTGDATAPG